MKWLLLIATVVTCGSTAKAACPFSGLRTRTVTTTKQAVKLEPKTVVAEKTVLVPTKVQVAETKLVPTPATVTTVRSRVRGILRETLPCPNCK